CLAIYKALKQQHATEPDLFLRASGSTVALLDDLSSRFDTAMKALCLYQSSMTTTGVPAYRHDFNLKKIIDYSSDGSDAIDFLQEEVNIWDYGTFAADVRKKIINDILPQQEATLELLTGLSSMEGAVVSVTLPFDRFRPYDAADPLPLALARLYVANGKLH